MFQSTVSTPRLYLVTFIGAVFAFMIDRMTKYIALERLEEPIVIIQGVLQLHTVPNENFLFYWELSEVAVFSSIGVVMLLLLFTAMTEYFAGHHRHVAMMILILVGAFSNLLDRIQRGAVTDFIDVPFWSVFNLADIYIVVGVFALLLFLWKYEERTAYENSQRKE